MIKIKFRFFEGNKYHAKNRIRLFIKSKKTLVDYRLIFIGIEIDFFPFFYLRLNQFGGDRFGGFFLLLTAEKGKIN